MLAAVSAAGIFEPPFVLFPGVDFTGANPDDFNVGYTKNGWMNSECFYMWLTSLFYLLIANKVAFPVLILLDGHTSHINIAVAEFCIDKGIILFCFPAHASHILQPLDVSVFGPMKKTWNSELEAFHKEHRIPMARKHFFKVFNKTWMKAAKQDNGVSGFKSTRLVPLNPERVDYLFFFRRNSPRFNSGI